MKIRWVRKTDIIVVMVFVVLLLIVAEAYRRESMYGIKMQLYSVESCLKLFIDNNKGLFPESKEQLLNQGLIKQDGDSNLYFVRCAMGDVLAQIYNRLPSKGSRSYDFPTICVSFDEIQINYGVKYEDIRASGTRLWGQTNGQEVVLIHWEPKVGYFLDNRIEELCRSISFSLFQEMRRIREKDGKNL